jgi:MoaA/NifB/PqqE/SkfB family radical SAM enzyme
MSKEIFFDKKRQYLHEILPLDTPFSVNIEPSSLCNIKCRYCIHSTSQEHIKEINPTRRNMDIRIFQNIIRQLEKFPSRLKTLVVNGVGEPMCNPYFVNFLNIAKSANIAERIEFFTNGTLLTPEISTKLITSGVDRIKISLQGVNMEQYKKVCGCAIDFDKLYENIKYLSSVKDKVELVIKIINIGLNDKNDYNKFLFLFEPICDKISVECVSPFFDAIDYREMLKNAGGGVKELQINMVLKLKKNAVCPIPFYRLYINVLGDVFFCYTCRRPAGPYNCLGQEDFLRTMLRKKREGILTCSNCTMLYDAAFSEYDNIDLWADKILDKIDNKEIF